MHREFYRDLPTNFSENWQRHTLTFQLLQCGGLQPSNSGNLQKQDGTNLKICSCDFLQRLVLCQTTIKGDRLRILLESAPEFRRKPNLKITPFGASPGRTRPGFFRITHSWNSRTEREQYSKISKQIFSKIGRLGQLP